MLILFCAGLLCAFFIGACNTRIEGCLDLYASNFDLNAEKSCTDCCTYPSVSLILSQKWEDRNFSVSDIFYDGSDQPFRIIDLKYFLSSWSWLGIDKLRYTVDSTDFNCNNSIITLTPDHLLIDSRQFNYTLGTYHYSPDLDSLFFMFGLQPGLQCNLDTTSELTTNLSIKSPLWDPSTTTLATLRLILQPDTSDANLDTFYLHDLRVISLDFDQDIKPGFTSSLGLTVDYAQWFSQANIHDTSSIRASILAGLKESIIKTP